jgi:inner membrane protein
MSTLPSHAVAAAGLVPLFFGAKAPKPVWILAMVASMLPDFDVIGFRLGIPYGHTFGHRGFSHSLLAAALVAGLCAVLARQGELRWRLTFCVFVAMVSHGLLDAMTSGGLGVGFFAPFSNTRYFLPWRPIRVSPFGWHWLFSHRGYVVLMSEMKWVWLPSLGLAGVGWLSHRARCPQACEKPSSPRGGEAAHL